MKRWMRLGLSLLALAVAAQGVALGEDLKTQQAWDDAGFFPILPWGPYHGWGREKAKDPSLQQGMESIKECGFTIAGFVRPSDLKECERLGLKGLVVPESGNLSTWMRGWKNLSDAAIDERIRSLVQAAGSSPAVLGYFLTDEPGADAFAALGKAVAAVKKYAPGKLAYINLYPGYATIGAKDTSQLKAASYQEYLERYVAEVKPQFISYDNYQVQYSMDLKIAARAVSYYKDLLEVRAVALRSGLPFWNIVSSNQIRPTTTIPSPDNLRLQGYTTLAAGGRGVSWYTYYAGAYAYAPIGMDGGKTPTWGMLREVNHELAMLGPIMNGLKSVGLFFSEPPPVTGAPVRAGKFIEGVESDGPVMVGEFEDAAGKPRVMIVNLSLERSIKVAPRRQGIS